MENVGKTVIGIKINGFDKDFTFLKIEREIKEVFMTSPDLRDFTSIFEGGQRTTVWPVPADATEYARQRVDDARALYESRAKTAGAMLLSLCGLETKDELEMLPEYSSRIVAGQPEKGFSETMDPFAIWKAIVSVTLTPADDPGKVLRLVTSNMENDLKLESGGKIGEHIRVWKERSALVARIHKLLKREHRPWPEHEEALMYMNSLPKAFMQEVRGVNRAELTMDMVFARTLQAWKDNPEMAGVSKIVAVAAQAPAADRARATLKRCFRFEKGECKFGEKCKFAHVEGRKEKKREAPQKDNAKAARMESPGAGEAPQWAPPPKREPANRQAYVPPRQDQLPPARPPQGQLEPVQLQQQLAQQLEQMQQQLAVLQQMQQLQQPRLMAPALQVKGCGLCRMRNIDGWESHAPGSQQCPLS